MQFRLEVIIVKTSIDTQTQRVPKLTVCKTYPLNAQRGIARPIPMLSFIDECSCISFRRMDKGDYFYTVPGVVKLINGCGRRKTPTYDRHDLKCHFGRVVGSIRQKSIKAGR